MIFFPLRTDRRLKTTPWVNYTLIGLNVLIFLLTREDVTKATAAFQALQQGAPGTVADILNQYPIIGYYLWPGDMHVYQYFSYQFLHQDWMHLIFNMIFLYVFGNGVEDHLGKIGYIFFYLAAGIVAGLGHALMEANPVLGASGSIAGVTGAYLALFPLSNVTIAYWFLILGSFEVSSMLLILFRVGQDFVFQLLGISNVAYLAHLSGYAFGFAVGMGLLLTRLVPREPYDMLALIEQKRRRSQFKRLTRGGFQPWESGKPSSHATADIAKPGQTFSPEEQELVELRARIATAIGRGKLPEAARSYAELLKLDSGQVLSEQHQLDIANQLMAERRYDAAATAYELFLNTYKTYRERHHVQLILGLIYARYLDQKQRARDLLGTAIDHLTGDDKQLAQTVLGEIQ